MTDAGQGGAVATGDATPRPVLISGPSRSGTTLLYRLLDDVPGTFNFLDEGYFFEILHDLGADHQDLFTGLHRAAPVDALVDGARERMVFTFLDEGYVQRGGTVNLQQEDVPFDADWLAGELKDLQGGGLDGPAPGDLDPVRLWHRWVRAFMAAMGKDPASVGTVFLKSPDYGRTAATGLELLPAAKALLIVRDPRYAIDSLKRSRQLRDERPLTPFRLAATLREYRRFLELSQGLRDRVPDRVHLVRYEDLARDTDGTMRDVAAFLDLPFTDAMLTPTIVGRPWHGLSSYHRFDDVSTKSLDRELAALEDWEVAYISEQLAEFDRAFGYGAGGQP